MCGVDTSLVQACRQQRVEQKTGKRSLMRRPFVTDEATSKIAVQILKRAPVIVKRKVVRTAVRYPEGRTLLTEA